MIRVKALAPEAQVVALQPTPPTDYAKHASQHLLDQLAKIPAVKSAVEQILKSVNLRGISTGRSHDGDVVRAIRAAGRGRNAGRSIVS
jgi:hypothetical protein